MIRTLSGRFFGTSNAIAVAGDDGGGGTGAGPSRDDRPSVAIGGGASMLGRAHHHVKRHVKRLSRLFSSDQISDKLTPTLAGVQERDEPSDSEDDDDGGGGRARRASVFELTGDADELDAALGLGPRDGEELIKKRDIYVLIREGVWSDRYLLQTHYVDEATGHVTQQCRFCPGQIHDESVASAALRAVTKALGPSVCPPGKASIELLQDSLKKKPLPYASHYFARFEVSAVTVECVLGDGIRLPAPGASPKGGGSGSAYPSFALSCEDADCSGQPRRVTRYYSWVTLNEARDTIVEWSEMVVDAAENWGLVTEQQHTALVELVHQRGRRGPGMVPVFQLGEQCVPDFPLNYDARLSSTAFTRYQNFLTWLDEHEPIDALIDRAKAAAAAAKASAGGGAGARSRRRGRRPSLIEHALGGDGLGGPPPKARKLSEASLERHRSLSGAELKKERKQDEVLHMCETAFLKLRSGGTITDDQMTHMRFIARTRPVDTTAVWVS